MKILPGISLLLALFLVISLDGISSHGEVANDSEESRFVDEPRANATLPGWRAMEFRESGYNLFGEKVTLETNL